jgi:hypothetical protein
MDDYLEFKHAHEIEIEEWWLYQFARDAYGNYNVLGTIFLSKH